jgi:hypothetical protein
MTQPSARRREPEATKHRPIDSRSSDPPPRSTRSDLLPQTVHFKAGRILHSSRGYSRVREGHSTSRSRSVAGAVQA